MNKHMEVELTPRQRFMQIAQAEMAKFERREIEFRKKDREDRAEQLRMPLDVDVH